MDRVQGGEKNEKSGTPWSKAELLEVYFLFNKLKGEGLHERNPEIIKLANSLNRTVRSTEAQTLMFRNLKKNGNYSHGNMNKLCKKIWHEMEEKDEYVIEPNIFNPGTTEMIEKKAHENYPAGLLEWAGHKRGGVKKPFDKSTGRPNGKVIKTQLTEKIDQWVNNLGSNSPRIILLIGGPGNGKTDALEYLVTSVDQRYKTTYYEDISKLIKEGGNVAPRSIEIDLDIDHFGRNKLTLVQDASIGGKDLSSGECLIKDLEKVINNQSIYIAGINRGILAEAVSKAEGKVYDVLNSIIQGLTQYIKPQPLWPLGKNDSILREFAVWPMDVESLVMPRENFTLTPGYQIIKEAVDDRNWNCDDCKIQDYCPFFQNKKALQNKENAIGLLQILSDFELIANNRWSFRELFSLVSYIIVGSENEFGELTPCAWARGKANQLADSNVKKRVQAVWDLNDHLYHARLFNIWPNFHSIARSSLREIKDILQASEITKEFFNYFSYTKSRKIYKPDIADIIDENFFSLIDPSQLSNQDNDFGRLIATVRQIEASFSYSVKAGHELVQEKLNPLEERLFQQLKEIENDLDERIRFEPSISSMRIDEILVLIRSLAARYFKRIHFTAKGISKDEIYLENYRVLNTSTDSKSLKLKKAKNLFDELIQEQGSLCLILNSSISQPQLEPEMQINLEVQRVKIKHSYIVDSIKDVPRNPMKIFQIHFEEDFHVPLTYALYKALAQLKNGVRPSSLPTAVLAMLDGIKSKLAGEIVRNPNILSNSKLRIGNSKFYYRIDEAETEIELTSQTIN